MPTEVKEERPALTIFWRIVKFPVWEDDCDGNEIESPNLFPRVLQGSCFQLSLYKKGSCHTTRKLWFELLHLGEAFDLPVVCEISILGYSTPLVIGNTKIHGLDNNMFQAFISSKTQNERSLYLRDGSLTIRCRFWKTWENFSEEESIFLETRIKTFEVALYWPILGFRTLELKREVIIPLTCEFFNMMNDFILKFSLEGESLDEARAYLELVPVSVRTIGLRALVKVSVVSWKGKLKKTVYMAPIYRFYEGIISESNMTELAIPISEIATRKELLKEKAVLRDDTLNLHCKVTSVRAISAIKESLDGLQM